MLKNIREELEKNGGQISDQDVPSLVKNLWPQVTKAQGVVSELLTMANDVASKSD